MTTAVRLLPDGFQLRGDKFQVMPPLSPNDRAKLKNSIEFHGVQIPIVCTADGWIVDGHHRWELALELGVAGSVPIDIREFADDDEAREAAFHLNDARRHMDLRERNELALRLRASGWTQKNTAEALGVSQPTIAEIERNSDLSAPDKSESLHSGTAIGGRRTANQAQSDALQARVEELHLSGVRGKDIATELGISESLVSTRIRVYRERNGIPQPQRRAPSTPTQAPPPPEPKWHRAADLAAHGSTSEQIATELNVHQSTVKKWAKRHGFELAADRLLAGTRRIIDHNTSMIRAVEGVHLAVTAGFRFIDPGKCDPLMADEWSRSLKDSSKEIQTLIRNINALAKKEQDQ